MSTKSKTAVILVDMLVDFVTGAIQCDRAQRIIPPLQKLVAAARKAGAPVIYSNDCHLKGIDKELKIWGDHAIKGTPGAEVIPELKPEPIDYIVPKRRYSGFFQTDLHLLLKELNIETVIITGLHADCCVRHTSADAFQWGFNVVIPTDGTEAFSDEKLQIGIDYLKVNYGAVITTVDDAIKTL
jgi:nicotinamidase-related amidase